jgi:RNA 3'-terminal phosphate cyclase (ATP)
MKVERKGWFPRGGGIVRLTTNPVKTIPAFTLVDRGDLKVIRGQAIVSGKVGVEVAKAMVKSATNLLRKTIPSVIPIEIQTIEEKGHDGCAMMLIAETTTVWPASIPVCICHGTF